MKLNTNEIQDLLADIKRLLAGAQYDYAEKILGNHELYISELNKLLTSVRNAGIDVDLNNIKEADRDEVIPVSRSYSIYDSSVERSPIPMRPSSASKTRKLREIINISDRLQNIISRMVGDNSAQPKSSLDLLENLFAKFHVVVGQLKIRQKSRLPLELKDEYDVQDLLHALLRIYFEDIRQEEWTPSYAGGSARMDFLLKAQQIVIETKKIRKGLTAKKLGEELIVDIEKYSNHQDCKTLVCFVYDPESMIVNPRGIEVDLNSRSNEKLKVLVFIKPSAT